MKLQRRIKAVQSFLRQRREALSFGAVRDPRRRRGRRWSAQTLLATAVVSLMMLARSLRAAERLSEDLAGAGRFKGLVRRLPDSTLGDFLAEVSPTPLRRHLRQQILAEHRRKALEPTVLPIRAIAVDGKNVATLDHEANPDCQKQSPEDQAPHWLYRVVNATLISSTAAVCVDQQPIPADTNDMGVFPSFFAGLMRTYGRANLFDLVTADAGFCSEANARIVDAAGKAYWISLKDNQPELRREAERVLRAVAKQSAPEAQTDWESDSSRGWIRRQLWRTDEMAAWGKWTHLRQVVLVRVLVRDGRDGPERVLEDRYYVTNLVRGRLHGEALLRLVRAHWRIENDLHGALDIQWQEDHGRWVQRGNGLPVSALLRVLAYNLLSLLRAVHLRTREARAAAWEQLRNWVRDAMVWPDLAAGDEEPSPVTP
jgi:predicted transposase YbfD/YdcC